MLTPTTAPAERLCYVSSANQKYIAIFLNTGGRGCIPVWRQCLLDLPSVTDKTRGQKPMCFCRINPGEDILSLTVNQWVKRLLPTSNGNIRQVLYHDVDSYIGLSHLLGSVRQVCVFRNHNAQSAR